MEVTRKMMLKAYRKPECECMVELTFDLEHCLKYMAEKAYANKSKKTKFGHVTVKVRPTERGKAMLIAHKEAIQLGHKQEETLP